MSSWYFYIVSWAPHYQFLFYSILFYPHYNTVHVIFMRQIQQHLTEAWLPHVTIDLPYARCGKAQHFYSPNIHLHNNLLCNCNWTFTRFQRHWTDTLANATHSLQLGLKSECQCLGCKMLPMWDLSWITKAEQTVLQCFSSAPLLYVQIISLVCYINFATRWWAALKFL